MKHCELANACCYGSCYEKNVCAFNETIEEQDSCPAEYEKYLSFLILSERKNDNGNFL